MSQCNLLEDIITKSDTARLLAAHKRHRITLAPFLEAAMAFSTTWVRRQRGLTSEDSWDSSRKVVGSFSNAMSRRNELSQSYQRCLGMAMSGIVTKMSAGRAIWSNEALEKALPSPLDSADRIPASVEENDLEVVVEFAKSLSEQYRAGRVDENWLKYDQVTMFSVMQAEHMYLSNEAFYPSQPWLSSVGKLDLYLSPSRPIPNKTQQGYFSPDRFDPAKPSADQLGSSNLTLEVDQLRITGRANIAQPVCHAYSFRGELTITVAYPEWLYDTNKNGRNSKRHGIDYADRASIIPLWYSVMREILQVLIDEPV